MRNRIGLRLFSAAILANLISFPSTATITQGNLNITVDGLKSKKGRVCISLFASNRGFPGDSRRAVQAKCIKVQSSSVVASFSNLKPGSYAVAAMHDANSDGALNSNVLGIPIEGFGFSRNPQIISGPPKFGDTSFLVVGNSTKIEIQLKYLI